MSIEWSFKPKETPVNETDAIITQEFENDGYSWIKVKYRTGENEIEIGSYFTYNYSSSREWMEHNENYIVLMCVDTYGYDVSDPYVISLFDIKSKRLISGTREELLEIYYQEFKGISKQMKKSENM